MRISFIDMLPANSDGVLLYLLRFRVTQQSSVEEAETVPMAAIDHGRLGYCDGERSTDQEFVSDCL